MKETYLAFTMPSHTPALTRFSSSGTGLATSLALEELGEDSSGGSPRAILTFRLRSTWRLDLCSAATNLGSNRKCLKKLVTSPCVAEELVRDMLGRDDRIGFSILSRKLPDLSSEAAIWVPRCPAYDGLSGLPEDTSNLLDVAIALVSTHPLTQESTPKNSACQRYRTMAHKVQI